jgi:hypothetical protein
MDRITVKDLESTIDRLNQLAHMPSKPYVRLDSKTDVFTPQAGCYILDSAYGGHKLSRMSLDEGCTGHARAPIYMGYVSKRECYNLINAFMNGLIEGGLSQSKQYELIRESSTRSWAIRAEKRLAEKRRK